jgi:hypothetical protein
MRGPWVICVLAGLLISCGGGGEIAEPQAVGPAPAARYAVIPSIATLMEWAQATYPQYFSGAATDGYTAPFVYRYFTGTDTSLKVDGNNIYVHGPVSGYNDLFVGTLADFACPVFQEHCDANPHVLVTTLAGSGKTGYADGAGNSAAFNGPSRLAADAHGNLFVADTSNHVIRKITPDGVVATFAGNGSAGHADGTGSAATFYQPMGLAFGPSGNLYVADSGNHKIRKITPAGVVTTYAGSGFPGANVGPALGASFNSPRGVAVDSAENVYVADSGNHMIRLIKTFYLFNLSTPVLGLYLGVSNFAGTATAGFGDGSGSSASFRQPSAVTSDGQGNLYVADQGNNAIRRISASGVVSTIAGSGASGAQNGTGGAATFSSPSDLALDASGGILVADSLNGMIRSVTTAGSVSTFAGVAGSASSSSADGDASSVHLGDVQGVAVSPGGLVFLALQTPQLIKQVIATYSAHGSVSGLSASGLVLSTGIPAQPILRVAANASEFFIPNLTAGTAYSLSVQSQPDGLTCGVSNASGTVGNSNAATPSVSCTSLGSPQTGGNGA